MGPFEFHGGPTWPPNPQHSSPPARPRAPRIRLERETGFEPATPSLEGWRSTAELFQHAGLIPRIDVVSSPTMAYRTNIGRAGAPHPSLEPPTTRAAHDAVTTMVGRGGFEPPKAFASRFTVCPLWPLGYLPERAGMAMKNLSSKQTSSKTGAGGR